MLYLFLIGLISILGQTALLRELNVASYGVDLIYTLALGVWFIWTALGALICSKRVDPGHDLVRALLLAFALVLPADVAFIRGIRVLFSETPGAYLQFGDQVLAMGLALLPVGLLSGLAFQLAARASIAAGGSLAAAYAIESIGGLAGGLCSTLFLKFGVQNLAITLLCSLIALSPFCLPGRGGRRLLRAFATVAAVTVIGMLARTGPIDRALTARTHPDLLAVEDTPYGRLTVTKQGNQVALFENDGLTFETEETDAEEFVDMAALLHPQPSRVLLVGGGVEGDVGEMLKHKPERVDYVELNPALLHLVTPLLPDNQQAPLRAPQVHIAFADARVFLRSAGRYDLILIGMPEPASGPANRYYTTEFFSQCAAHLNESGILAFRLKSAENLWTPQQTARAASIYRALKSVLPQVQVLPGATNVFAASRQPLARDPEILAARLQARGIKARLVCAPYIRYVYTNDRFAAVARTLETADEPANSDARPVCYQYTLMIWLSKFYPDLTKLNLPSSAGSGGYRAPIVWITGVVVLALFIVARGRPSMRRALWAGTAGAVGMIFETLILLRYQVASGVLFQDIGLLLMSFMAGLAAGSWVAHRQGLSAASGRRPGFGRTVALGFAVFGLVLAAWMQSDFMAGLATSAIALGISGALVAAAFVSAGFDEVGNPGAVVAPLYSADLVGGCVGTLASSLVLIPMAGMTATAASVAPLGLLSLLLIKRSKC